MSKILINVVSQSMGDNISVVPYADLFTLNNKQDSVYLSISEHLIKYFENIYTNIIFVSKNSDIIFDKVLNLEYDFNESVQGGYAKQLGFMSTNYIRPKMDFTPKERPIKGKYITIGIHSTSQLKYWNNPKGKKSQLESPYWNELCGMIRKYGYTPVVVEKDEMFGIPPFRNGIPRKSNKKFGQSLDESMNLIYHSEFYIGLSSGMSWVSHALNKKVAMIANFTEDWNEFDLSLSDYIRITNKSVCHGCWHTINKDYNFDTQDWYWCPKHKDTPRQFECHTSITPEIVFNEIKKWIN